MRSEPEALKRCEKHGLNYDPRLTRGCVVCRRQADDPGGSQKSTQYTLSGFALVAALGVFGWIYVKPLIVPDGEARHSFIGLSPNSNDGRPKSGPGAETNEGAPNTEAANAEKSAPAQPLHAVDSALWAEIARALESYEGSEPVVKELRGSYGIHVYIPREAQFDLVQGRLAGTRPTTQQIAEAAGKLMEELSRYPRPFASQMGLQQFVLVSGLRHKGQPVGAFAMGPVSALFADPEGLAPGPALHHELFHFVDYRVHGMPANHRAFIALNPAGARYRTGRVPPRQGRNGSSSLAALRRDLPGFVTEYAQADAAEDMAEVFALLMTQRPELYQLTTTDAVIAAKLTYVIQTLDKIAPSTTTALNL